MRETLETLGWVVRLQVQIDSLKIGTSPRRYDPGPIVAVDRVVLEADGVVGYTPKGSPQLDVHHRHHPHSRFRGDNWISFGFTGHYRAMQARFGADLADGIAGENILVADERTHEERRLEHGLVIESSAGPVHLMSVHGAPPCVEFTRFCLGFSGEPDRSAVTAGLDFLARGMRGFYAQLASGPAEIRLGDMVYGVGRPDRQ